MRRIFKTLLLFFLFILIAGFSTYLSLTLIIKGEDIVTVPDLTGKDLISVLEILTEAELNVKFGGSEHHPDIPKNHVVYQHPEPGKKVKKDRDVRITISKGSAIVLMPDLRGIPLYEARIFLEENGLCHARESLVYDSVIQKDEVIAQSPSPGLIVRRGDCVNLLVSAGPRPKAYKMPDLEGLSLDDAMFLLENMNLVPGEIRSVFYVSRPRNVILEQEPRFGQRVTEGTRVNLLINRRPGSKEDLHGEKGDALVRYRTESGFLNRRVRVEIKTFGFSQELFNDFVKPDKEIWLLIPKNDNINIFVYEDENLTDRCGIEDIIYGTKKLMIKNRQQGFQLSDF